MSSEVITLLWVAAGAAVAFALVVVREVVRDARECREFDAKLDAIDEAHRQHMRLFLERVEEEHDE